MILSLNSLFTSIVKKTPILILIFLLIPLIAQPYTLSDRIEFQAIHRFRYSPARRRRLGWTRR